MIFALALFAGMPIEAGIRWIDVGQGAALLAQGSSGQVVLVDSGPSGGAEAITAALLAHEVDQIDLWIHTHMDADHIGGATRVRAGADGRPGTRDDPQVLEAWDHGGEPWPATEAVQAYRSVFAGERRKVRQGTEWAATGLTVRVLEAPALGDDENERSLTLCMDVEETTVLILGDTPASVGSTVALQCPGVDVLWASHHGAFDGISPQLVAHARPRLVVISAGRDNGHCHPSPRTLALLANTPVWVIDGAGLNPGGPCPGLGSTWGPNHHLAAGDLWLAASAEMR